MKRVFFSDKTGSLGKAIELDGVPRVGDYVWHPLGEFKVISVSWWRWGPSTVSLMVERVADLVGVGP